MTTTYASVPVHDLAELSWHFDDLAFNQGNMDAALDLIADDFVNHDPLPGQEPTRAGLAEYVPLLRQGLPDLECHNEMMVVQGDRLAHIIIFSGTHTGEFFGVAPTGKRVTFRSHDFQRWENGKMKERWAVADTSELEAILSPDK